MFARSALFICSALLVLFSAVALGAPHGRRMHNLQLASHVASSAATIATDTAGALEKRYDNARFTYYDAGENACGSTDSGSAYVSDQSHSLPGCGAGPGTGRDDSVCSPFTVLARSSRSALR